MKIHLRSCVWKECTVFWVWLNKSDDILFHTLLCAAVWVLQLAHNVLDKSISTRWLCETSQHTRCSRHSTGPPVHLRALAASDLGFALVRPHHPNWTDGLLMGKRSDGEKRLSSWTGYYSAWQTGIWNSILLKNTPLLAEPDGLPGGQEPAVWGWDFITRASREDVLGGTVMRASQQVQSSRKQIYRLTWHLTALVALFLRIQELLAQGHLLLQERLV